MILQFKVHELKESSRYYGILFKDENTSNEFIIIGEDSDNYKAHKVDDRGICLIPGVSMNEFSLIIPKNDFAIKTFHGGIEIREFDIPKQYLDLDTVESIQRLNNLSDTATTL
jgi:hypothetical protein